MRKFIEVQPRLDQTPIEEVELDLTSRDEMVQVLAGLQHLYTEGKERLNRIVSMIETDVLGRKKKRKDLGRLGMTLWEILVLAAVKLGCGEDYDRIHDLANNHKRLRQIMGCEGQEPERQLGRTTIYQNLDKLTRECIEAICDEIVAMGHELEPEAIRKIRADGFVVETNIHYPSDSAQMLDGVRVTIREVAKLSKDLGLKGWRQCRHLHRKAKKMARKIQKAAQKKSPSLTAHYQTFIEYVREIEERVVQSIEEARSKLDGLGMMERIVVEKQIEDIEEWVSLTQRVCEQAERRMILDEKVPSQEKIFSLFEVHTVLIRRGKAGKQNEFGRRVIVVEDQVGFILKASVLERGQEEKAVVVPIFAQLQKKHDGKIVSASFDRGGYSKKNKKDLQEIVEVACLPKPGKLNQTDIVFESDEEFKKARQHHSGIESAIHALMDGNGLRRCPDKGEKRLKRYVALGALGRNLQILGKLVLKKCSKAAKKQLASVQ